MGKIIKKMSKCLSVQTLNITEVVQATRMLAFVVIYCLVTSKDSTLYPFSVNGH